MIKEPEAPNVEEVELPSPELDFEEKMALWLEALESGRYEQCSGKLHTPFGYCCLGVADETVFGTTWQYREYDHVYVDDLGVDSYLYRDRMRKLNLHLPVTKAEVRLAAAKFQICKCPSCFPPSKSRERLLINLNDATGATFADIAAFIRECGWDKGSAQEAPE